MCRGSQRFHVFGFCMALLMTMDGQAAPEPVKPATEVPRVVMKNLRTEGQFAGKGAIELPRKKFVAIDADLEAGTWGFTRTTSFQVTYIVKDGAPPNTFPDQIISHPAVETDPVLMFMADLYRGDQPKREHLVSGTIALFGNEQQPWKAKVRYWITTPDQPGEYTMDFTVCDQEQTMNGKAEVVKLTQQKIVIK